MLGQLDWMKRKSQSIQQLIVDAVKTAITENDDDITIERFLFHAFDNGISP
jgi:hypothetical protein